MTDERNRKYWVYQHDQNGDFVKDIVYESKLRDAIDAVGLAIRNDYPWSSKHSIHVVDQEQDNTTVWVAGSCTLDGREGSRVI